MLKHLILLALTSLTFATTAQVSFKTGNVQLDADLNSINIEANADFGGFKADLSASYNVSEQKIDYLKGTIGMNAGEIYLALEIGKITDSKIDDIVKIYQANKTKGWGVIAKEAGIKPGSPEFHQLKNSASNKKTKVKNKGKKKKK